LPALSAHLKNHEPVKKQPASESEIEIGRESEVKSMQIKK
jgi:hypothetical protein